MQRSTDMSTTHHSSIWSLGSIKGGDRKIQGPEDQEVFCETVSPGNVCLNKSRTMAVSLTWEGGGISVWSHIQKKNYRKLRTSRKRRRSPWQAGSPLLLAQGSMLIPETIYTQITKVDPKECNYYTL